MRRAIWPGFALIGVALVAVAGVRPPRASTVLDLAVVPLLLWAAAGVACAPSSPVPAYLLAWPLGGALLGVDGRAARLARGDRGAVGRPGIDARRPAAPGARFRIDGDLPAIVCRAGGICHAADRGADPPRGHRVAHGAPGRSAASHVLVLLVAEASGGFDATHPASRFAVSFRRYRQQPGVVGDVGPGPRRLDGTNALGTSPTRRSFRGYHLVTRRRFAAGRAGPAGLDTRCSGPDRFVRIHPGWAPAASEDHRAGRDAVDRAGVRIRTGRNLGRGDSTDGRWRVGGGDRYRPRYHVGGAGQLLTFHGMPKDGIDLRFTVPVIDRFPVPGHGGPRRSASAHRTRRRRGRCRS